MLCFSVRVDLASPHFSGLHALSAVVRHVHKGHLAHAPWLRDPSVLVAVTLARDNLIYLKHTQFSVISSQVPDGSGKPYPIVIIIFLF